MKHTGRSVNLHQKARSLIAHDSLRVVFDQAVRTVEIRHRCREDAALSVAEIDAFGVDQGRRDLHQFPDGFVNV